MAYPGMSLFFPQVHFSRSYGHLKLVCWPPQFCGPLLDLCAVFLQYWDFLRLQYTCEKLRVLKFYHLNVLKQSCLKKKVIIYIFFNYKKKSRCGEDYQYHPLQESDSLWKSRNKRSCHFLVNGSEHAALGRIFGTSSTRSNTIIDRVV